MPRKKTVVIGLLGTTLDVGEVAGRWERWRPSVSICQHEDLLIDRFELLRSTKADRLAQTVMQDIATVSPETEVRTHTIDFADAWDFEEVYGALHDFAREYPFDTEREEYLVHITTGTHVAQICMFLLVEAHYLPGKLIQTAPPAKRGPGHGAGTFRVIDLDLSKYDRLAERFKVQQREGLSSLKSGIDTRNTTFNALIEQIEHVASHSTDPILLTGPTGAGKSLLARRIYELKKQRRQVAGAFVEVNCATLRGDAAMSALFGHKKGAFTGALQDRAGLLIAANKGLLFLDEVGELGLDEQAMLLRALEEKAFLPLGSDVEQCSDFQLITGTNRDLARQVRAGKFREDLLARMNLWTFRLPGLRERREDIEPNIQYELDQFARRSGLKIAFNREAGQRFLEFATSDAAAWRANFRDLGAAVTRMATLASGGRITVELVEQETARLARAWSEAEPDGDRELLEALLEPGQLTRIDRFDRVQLADVIRVCRQSRNLSDAGRTLFAASRMDKKQPNDADRLRKYLARFGLTWAGVAQDAL
jgi:transcriptional regulatory protein RtcR